jgi:hypothetical protein
MESISNPRSTDRTKIMTTVDTHVDERHESVMTGQQAQLQDCPRDRRLAQVFAAVVDHEEF